MKRFTTMLLLLSLVLSLMSGVSISAFAAEDVADLAEIVDPILLTDSEDIPADNSEEAPADDAEEAPADDAEEAPADDAEEAPADDAEEAPADDAEEAPADEVEELPDLDLIEVLVKEVETTVAEVELEAPVLHGDMTWTKADGFVDGQDYVIGLDNGDGSYVVLQCSEAKVSAVLVNDLTEIKETMIWTAGRSGSGGTELTVDPYKLYFKSGDNFCRTNSSAKWYYTTDGNLYYAGGGSGKDYYFLTFDESNAMGTVQIKYRTAMDEAAEVVILTSGTDLGTASTPLSLPLDTAAATELTDGTMYLFGIQNAGTGYTVLKEVEENLVVAQLDDPANATDDMLWLATHDKDGKYSFENVATGHKLSYKDESDGGYCIRSKGSSPKKWTYAEGVLCYDGATYLVVTEESVTPATAAGTNSLLLWSAGTGESDGATDPGDGGGDSGSSGTFTETNQLGAYPYIIIVDASSSTAIGMDMGNYLTSSVTIAGEAPNRTASVSKGLCAGVIAGANGFAITLQDPPGSVNFVCVTDGALSRSSTGTAEEFANWNLDEHGHLGYTIDGVTYYFKDITGTITTSEAEALVVTIFGGTEYVGAGGKKEDDEDTAAFAPVIVTPPEALPYVLENSNYAAPELSVVAAYPDRADYDPDGYVPEGAEYDPKNFSIKWSVDGAELSTLDQVTLSEDGFTSSVILNSLRGKTSGVYTITCTVSCDTWTVAYQKEGDTKLTDENGRYIVDEANSGYKTYSSEYSVSFTVCKGILENSLLTFSDVHETWDSVGQAIANTIQDNGFLIPSLIICTGDWYNDHYEGGEEGSENYNGCMDIIGKLYAQVSGIDIVFLAGNHDNTNAAVDATIDAGLGATEEDLSDGAGILFDSSLKTNSTSDASDGLIVYGINYESLQNSSYAAVYDDLKHFLETLAADYNGELVIISSHTGLHVVGEDTHSDGDSWGGGNSYNVDMSADMVELINQYAETMDIMFFFGHDHSKGETEFLANIGDELLSTVSYADKSTRTNTLKFTYGHAGYIGSGAAGTSGRNYYTLVTWDGEEITRTMTKVSDATEIEALTATYTRVAEQPAPEDPDDGNEPDGNEPDGNEPDDDNSKPDTDKDNKAPKTGDDANIVLWIAVLVLCAGSLAILPRKKHN